MPKIDIYDTPAHTKKYLGKQIGDFTVLAFVGYRPYRKRDVVAYYRCECLCSRIVEVPIQELSETRPRSCGQCKKWQTLLRNAIRGQLNYIFAQAGRTQRSHIRKDIQKNRSTLHRHHKRLRQKYKECFYCGKNISSFTKKRQRLIYEAQISFSNFVDLCRQPCEYCGAKASPYNGLDRVDSSKGYELSNVVPCCTQCNYAKSDSSLNEFREWIHRLIAHQNSALFG